MDRSDFYSYITNDRSLNEESLTGLKKLVEEYPYFQTAHLLLAKNQYLTNLEEFERNLVKTAVFCADRSRLFYFINNEKYARFFPKEKLNSSIDRTQTLLSSYLETFSEEPEEIIPKMETNIISTDYLAYLQSLEKDVEEEVIETNQSEFKHQGLIDSFLEKAAANEISITPLEQESTQSQEIGAESAGDGFLTETLAKIYIKQKKYEQALAIIRQLSLNFPKKSIYFADQIRFLELLIFNEKNKKQ
ncbi:MAG: hypothetical protein Q4G63_10635 [Bacteroidia bacterium]|nr:hypothetical protein [Bacteroidia bacterium]